MQFLAFMVSVPALMTPAIIIGSKVFGCSPRRRAPVSLCCMPARCRCSTTADGPQQEALGETGRLAGVTLFCVTASAFSWCLPITTFPRRSWPGSARGDGRIATGFFVAAVFLVVAASSMRSRPSSSSAPSCC